MGINSSDLNAFFVRDDGSILMSFSGSITVPGITGGPSGTTVDDSDIFLFTPTSIGPDTAGSFSFYFDGSDVGLSTSGEDIDGLRERADGSLAITTTGSVSAPGLSARDEDVFIFTGTFGATTTGSWSLHFDGSDVGISSDLAAISESGPDLMFAANDGGIDGSENEDINRFVGSFGATTSGSATIEYDVSALGISGSEAVDGLHVG